MAFSINPGVWPVMITPWTEDNKPDFKAIKQLCDWYVEKGCTGTTTADITGAADPMFLYAVETALSLSIATAQRKAISLT